MSTRTEAITGFVDRIRCGEAGLGSNFYDHGVDISTEVRAEAVRCGFGSGSSVRSVLREYAFAEGRASYDAVIDRSPSSALEPLIAGRVAGYITRWDIPVAGTVVDIDGNERIERNAFTADAFTQWLADVLPVVVVVQRNHIGAIIGRWESLVGDDVGILGECIIFDTPDGRQALTDIRVGRLPGLSGRAVFSDNDTTIEHDADGPYRLIHSATLREAGPVDDPADDGALILAVDGVPIDTRSGMPFGDLLDELEAVTGQTREGIRLDARIAEHERRRHVKERVEDIERALTVHRRAHRKHALAVQERAHGLSWAPSFDEIADLADEVDEVGEWLRTHLDGDLFRSLVPSKVDLSQALLAGTLDRTRRSRGGW